MKKELLSTFPGRVGGLVATKAPGDALKLWRGLGFAALAVACLGFNGCATDAQSGSSYADAGLPLSTPDYYQSNDNPFHAD